MNTESDLPNTDGGILTHGCGLTETENGCIVEAAAIMDLATRAKGDPKGEPQPKPTPQIQHQAAPRESNAAPDVEGMIASGYWPSTVAYEILQRRGWDHVPALDKAQALAAAAQDPREAAALAMAEPTPTAVLRIPTLMPSAERVLKRSQPGDTVRLAIDANGSVHAVGITPIANEEDTPLPDHCFNDDGCDAGPAPYDVLCHEHRARLEAFLESRSADAKPTPQIQNQAGGTDDAFRVTQLTLRFGGELYTAAELAERIKQAQQAGGGALVWFTADGQVEQVDTPIQINTTTDGGPLGRTAHSSALRMLTGAEPGEEVTLRLSDDGKTFHGVAVRS